MRTDLLDIMDNGPGVLLYKKSKILCIILINLALKPSDGRAKYIVKDPDPYSIYPSGSATLKD